MPWLESINLIAIPGNWRLTPPIADNLVKINHVTSGLNESFFSGTIAQAEIDNNQILTLYDYTEITLKSYPQIFNFIKPAVFTNRRLAFRANDYGLLAAGQVWNWELSITPFRLDVTPIPITNNLSTVASAPIQANPLRTGLTILNSLNTTIFIDSVNTVSSTNYWFKLEPGDFYEMPQPIYIGALWLRLLSGSGSVQIREF